MIVVEFAQPAALMSMNDRQHWSTRAKLTKAWRTAAWAAAVNTGKRDVGPSIVALYLPVKDRRRRDPSNLAPTLKACVDGLTDAQFWRDDTPEWVATTEPVLVHGADVVRVEVVAR